MHFIRQIVEDEVEEWVHERFIRYGMGEFSGPVAEAKVGKNIKVKSSAGYVGILGELLCANSEGDVDVKGKIYARRDVEDEVAAVLSVVKAKKRRWCELEVEGAVPAADLLELYKSIPDAFLLLDLKSGSQKLSCKKKLPKPGSKLEDSFASATLAASALGQLQDEIFFDAAGGFKEASVSHTYLIDELVAPEGVIDSARIRVEAKRNGKLLRKLTVDGTETESGHIFSI